MKGGGEKGGDDLPSFFMRPDGVTVEVEENGDRRFSGEGGGVIEIYRGSGGKWVAVASAGGRTYETLDRLFLMRERLLLAEDATGKLVFPCGAVDLASPEAWREIFTQKGDLQSLIEALLKGKPQFFRDIADRFKTGPKTAKDTEEIRNRREVADGAVMHSIVTAASAAGDVPKFANVLEVYRNLRNYVTNGSKLWDFSRTTTANETTSNFRKKLDRIGFGWLAVVTD